DRSEKYVEPAADDRHGQIVLRPQRAPARARVIELEGEVVGAVGNRITRTVGENPLVTRGLGDLGGCDPWGDDRQDREKQNETVHRGALRAAGPLLAPQGLAGKCRLLGMDA